MSGAGSDAQVSEGHTLHPIIAPASAIFLDWDGDGQETISFVSSESHTHAPDRELVPKNFRWFDENDVEVGMGESWTTT